MKLTYGITDKLFVWFFIISLKKDDRELAQHGRK
jgi:hypothetical protein